MNFLDLKDLWCLEIFFKANEYRNFIFYTSFCLKDFLSEKYFNNILKYIIFLRLLIQDFIDENDLILSQQLIEDFINEYQELYGKENMTYNLHAHFHFKLLNSDQYIKHLILHLKECLKILETTSTGPVVLLDKLLKKFKLRTSIFFLYMKKLRKLKINVCLIS